MKKENISHEAKETHFGDTKSTKSRMKGLKKGAISKVLTKFKK